MLPKRKKLFGQKMFGTKNLVRRRGLYYAMNVMTQMICKKTGQAYEVSEKELQILHDISPVLE
jgi:hypothetical protein